MNILLITTGGTIGSAFDGGSINVRSDGGCAVADRYQAEHSGVQLEIKSPLNLLSERICADDFNTLAKALYEAQLSRYDGVIITAGSDNLAYISSFVGLLCADCKIPVMLVAANKILSAPDSNGYENFCCAAALIAQGTRGVFVPYRNRDGIIYVHSATDIRQADLSDDFYSFHGAYGVFENGVLQEKRAYLSQRIPAAFSRDNLPVLSDNVLMIHSYPMMDYAKINADGKNAVLHTLYHSATLDADAAVRFMESLGGVPLFLASLRRGQKLYATTAQAVDAGAIPLYDISPECAYMKLLLACSQDEISLINFLEDNI